MQLIIKIVGVLNVSTNGSPRSSAVFNSSRILSYLLYVEQRIYRQPEQQVQQQQQQGVRNTHTHTGHSTHTLSGELLTPPTLTQDQSEPPTGRTGGEGGSRGGWGATM